MTRRSRSPSPSPSRGAAVVNYKGRFMYQTGDYEDGKIMWNVPQEGYISVIEYGNGDVSLAVGDQPIMEPTTDGYFGFEQNAIYGPVYIKRRTNLSNSNNQVLKITEELPSLTSNQTRVRSTSPRSTIVRASSPRTTMTRASSPRTTMTRASSPRTTMTRATSPRATTVRSASPVRTPATTRTTSPRLMGAPQRPSTSTQRVTPATSSRYSAATRRLFD